MEKSIKILTANRHLRDEVEAAEFDFALAELSVESQDDVVYAARLFDVFVDDCNQPEVMWGLLHFVESFDDETYISALLTSANDLSLKAKDWLGIILSRVLNNDNSKNQLIAAIKNRSEIENETINKLLEKFRADEEPSLCDYASQVLLEIQFNGRSIEDKING